MRPTPARRSLPRSTSVVLGAVLALLVPGAAGAADGDPAVSLCDAVTVEALATLGPLQFEQPEVGAPSYCFFDGADGGGHSLTLATTGISLELMTAPDAVMYDISGFPAIEVEGSFLVDLGEERLAVTPVFADAPGTAGLDSLEYAIDVAEVVVPALGATTPDASAATFQPPAVEGLEWGRVDVRTLAEYIEADPAPESVFGALADGLGVDPADISLFSASGRDVATEELVGTYSAFLVDGVDDDRLRTGFVDWMKLVGGDDVSMEDLSVGGKDVTVLLDGGEPVGYLYVESGMVHAVPVPEEVAARVLDALP